MYIYVYIYIYIYVCVYIVHVGHTVWRATQIAFHPHSTISRTLINSVEAVPRGYQWVGRSLSAESPQA